MRTLLVVLLASVTLLSGCATRLGQFTAASSQNVRNLDYSSDKNSKKKVIGKSCATRVLFFPIGPQDDLIQRAMDSAISNGQAAGLDGDLLVNVRMDLKPWTAVIAGQNCVVVEGDLVTLSK